MKRLIMNNLPMKILSVLIAIAIWLLVANTNDPVITKKFTDIPVSIINDDVLEDEGYAYEVTDGQTVSISVKGKSSILSGMTSSNFEATADFSKLSVVDAVPIDITASRYQNQLEITITSTNTMKIKKDEVVEVNVPVNIDTTGDVADGYAVGKITGTPNLVKIKGPKNLVDDIKEIRTEVSIEDLSRNTTTTATPKVYDDDGNEVDTSQLTMGTSQIAIMIELWKTKEIDVNIGYDGTVADGYILTSFDYEPKKITVAASEDELDELTEINLDDIDLSGKTSSYEEDIEITQDLLPGNAILADSTTSVKIKAEIEELTTRTFTFSKASIKVKNNNGYTVTFDDTSKYTVKVEGPSSVISDLKIKDFDPWINLQDLDEGSHTLTLHLKELDNVEIESKSDVNVTLSSE